MPAKQHNILLEGPQFLDATTRDWVKPGSITKHAVIFIHGWASTPTVLYRFADYISAAGYYAAFFDYDPFPGIGKAAAHLKQLITNTPELTKHEFALIGHSMGGLVARKTRQLLTGEHHRQLQGMALLATPNAGIPTSLFMRQVIVARLAKIIDRAAGTRVRAPSARKRSCLATQELVLSDPGQFIMALNNRDRQYPIDCRTLTISAGRPELCFAAWADLAIKLILGNDGHDGIVPEASADLRSVIGDPKNIIEHRNQNHYIAWPDLNHNTILENQEVAQLLLGWLQNTL